jgi:hypothetical protein
MEPKNPERREEPGQTPRQTPRRRYEAPRLVEYGSVGKLTQTGGQTTKDTGNMKRVCL